jgi:hypothetical protein
MNKLDLLFDAKQFVIAFGAATPDSSAVSKKSKPGAQLKAGAAAADLSRDCVLQRDNGALVNLVRGDR